MNGRCGVLDIQKLAEDGARTVDAGNAELLEPINDHHLEDPIGEATVNVENLNIRSEATADSEKVGVAEKGKTYPVYENWISYNDQYNWLRVGENQWIADGADAKWVTFKGRDQ